MENLSLVVSRYKLEIALRRWVVEGTHQRWAQPNSYVDDTSLRIIYHGNRGFPQGWVRSREIQLINSYYPTFVWKQ